jgi:hypothetical protein
MSTEATEAHEHGHHHENGAQGHHEHDHHEHGHHEAGEHDAANELNGASPAVTDGAEGSNDVASKFAIAGVIGVGAALIEVSLIPGILVGAVAVLAPKYLPGIRDRLRPMLKHTIRGVYKATEKTREALAEAQEQVQDIMAEARHDEASSAGKNGAAAPARQG